jgi:hypothetical protein
LNKVLLVYAKSEMKAGRAFIAGVYLGYPAMRRNLFRGTEGHFDILASHVTHVGRAHEGFSEYIRDLPRAPIRDRDQPVVG